MISQSHHHHHWLDPRGRLEYLRYSQEYLNHVTFAPPRGGRPDGAGWFPRRVRTDGRVNLPGRGVRERYASCTFEQWMLFKEHSLNKSDSTMHDAPPATSRWPIWPTIDHARRFKCHGTTTHATAAIMGVCWHHPFVHTLPEHHRLAPCHWCRRTYLS